MRTFYFGIPMECAGNSIIYSFLKSPSFKKQQLEKLDTALARFERQALQTR